MTVSHVGDRKSYEADDDFAPDHQGIVLTYGNDGTNNVRPATAEDPFLGVVFRSTESPGRHDTEYVQGDPVAVEQDGWVNVDCEPGFEYEPGDTVYVSNDNAGRASPDDDPAGDGSVSPTRVGTVMRYRDTTGETGPQWVVVNITGAV